MSEVRALLLTDVVDSTQLSERLGEAELAAVWRERHFLPNHPKPPDHAEACSSIARPRSSIATTPWPLGERQ